MTDANRILDAADKAASDHFVYEDVRPIVVAALRELAEIKREDVESLEAPAYQGDDYFGWDHYNLPELADEIEGKNDD